MTHVRNVWYVAAWEQDLPEAQPFAITILDEPIVVYRSEGRLVALEDRCVHRMAPLSLGRCEGARLRCMYHGLLFDPDGKVVEIPGQELIPAQARVRSYPVVEKHSWIWVWMGDPARADEALIPPAVGSDDTDWFLGCGQLDYAASAELIHDNLCDFSHLSFVHANSFGATEDWAHTRPRVTPLARGVRFERWVPAQKGMRAREAAEPVDAWSAYDYLVPGVLLMKSASYPGGTAERLGFAPPPPDLEGASGVTFTSQAVTAMTAKTARYFFSWGPHRDHGDEALRDMLMGIAGQAFGEDKAMIEAQQRVIDATPNPRVMPTSADKGVTLYQRLVERLAREEAGEGRAAA
ncbi:MAG: aromatic ring-hydroxylating dioxygenase subunit alpha [Sphingomonadaceae bacterium]|nr:aromatic ring-hydroxylating dioxygenase subunit alpha [Sphingomonadaceae bacterium]